MALFLYLGPTRGYTEGLYLSSTEKKNDICCGFSFLVFQIEVSDEYTNTCFHEELRNVAICC